MKLFSKFIWAIFIAFPSFVNAQGTYTLVLDPQHVGNIINYADEKARDEVDLIPTSTGGDVRLQPGIGEQVHLFIDPSIILPGSYGTVNTNPQASPQTINPLDKNLPVGATRGSYAVSNGVATYNIPLILPPGTAGMAPSLSVLYSSASHSGILGDGWNLTGLSSITRTGKNIYHDNTCSPINLDNTDVLNLDGNRLISSGNNTFVSENENFSLISYDPNTDYYTIKTKEGRTMEYGHGHGSRVTLLNTNNDPGGGFFIGNTYYLSSVYDNYGNTIVYNYTQQILNYNTTYNSKEGQETVLEEIDYTLNNTVSPKIPAYNSVKFYYEKRTDLEGKFIRGNIIGSTLILREIEIDCEGKFMKKYDFKYGHNNINESLLNEIIEFGSDYSRLNSTVMEYFNPAGVPFVGGGAAGISYQNLDYAPEYRVGDFNGDGRSDLLGFHFSYIFYNNSFQRNYTSCDLNINNDYGITYTKQTNAIPNFPISSLPNNGPLGFNVSFTFNNPTRIGPGVIDVNGDGMDDIVLQKQIGSTITYYVYQSTGAGFTQIATFSPASANASFVMADIDGDKLPEAICFYGGPPISFEIFSLRDGSSQSTQLFKDKNGYSFPNPNLDIGTFTGLSTLDFDGDGISELMVAFGPNNIILKPIFSGGILQYVLRYNINFKFSSDLTAQLFPCDFNGDGISDFIQIPAQSNAVVFFGMGNPDDNMTENYFSSFPISNAPGYEQANGIYLVADANGDGKSDLILSKSSAKPGQFYDSDVFVAYGSGSIETVNPMLLSDNWGVPFNFTSAIDETHQTEFLTGDFDGNGTQECMFRPQYQGYPGIVSRYIFNPYTGGTSLLQAIVDGNDIKVHFDYNSIAEMGFDYRNTPHFSGMLGTYKQNPYYSKGSSIVNFPLLKSQKPIFVVTSVIVSTGTGEENIAYYKYEDAQVHLQGLGFLGFGKTTETNYITSGGYLPDPRSETVKTFSTLSCPISTGQKIYERLPLHVAKTYTVSSNQIAILTNHTSYNYSIFPLTTGSLQHFSAITSTSELDYNGGITVSSYTYDNGSNTNNNITAYTADVNNGLESYTVTSDYVTYARFPGIACKPHTMGTTVNRGGQTYFRENQLSYTNEGNILKIIQDPSADVPNGGNEKQVDITYTYDQHGVITQKGTSYIGTGAGAHTESYGYDPSFRFVTSSTNNAMQVTHSTYDPKWGKPLTVTGIDNLTTSYTYDGFGRNIETVTPDGLISTTVFDWVAAGETSSWTNDPYPVGSFAQYKITTAAGGKPTITTYYDMFGRQIKAIMDGFGNPINTITSYDDAGNINLQSNAYDPLNSTYKPIVTQNTHYDEFNRLVRTMQGNYGSSTPFITTFSYAYSSGTTTVTAATTTGKSSKVVTDATGLVTQSIDDVSSPTSSVSYIYNPQHNPISINVGGTTVANINYDAYGRKSSLTEKNSGVSVYDFNALGLLKSQTDNSNHTYTYLYDALNRPSSITGAGETYGYQYVGSGNGINQIEKMTGPNFDYNYKYDNLNRQIQTTEHIGTQTFTTDFTYDQFNNISKVSYPGGNFAVNKTYDAHSYLKQVTRADNNNIIWQATGMNPLGQYDNYKLGNNITVQKSFDDLGFCKNFSAYSGPLQIQNLDFNFDNKTGNLMSRTDHVANFGTGATESFTYDLLDRLMSINGPQSINMGYSANGNIQQKSDVGAYTYSTSKENAVVEVTNPNAEISTNTQTISYTPYNMAQTIIDIESKNQLDLFYGPDRQRRQTDVSTVGGGIANSTYYQRNYERKIETAGNATTEVHYINGGDGLCAMYVIENNIGHLYYVFKDHLGSILKLTDENGTTIAEQSFDAWGNYRNPIDWTNDFATNPPITNPTWLIRGYTGHEHLPQFSLINMNGRIYDPANGRMLSPDNFVTNGNSSQTFNRYTYANNNPLKYTDPNGEWAIFDDIAAILVGGLSNAAANWDHIEYGGQFHAANFFEYFGAGALGAEAGLYGGPAVGFAVGGMANMAVDALTGAYSDDNNPYGEDGHSDNSDPAKSFLKGGLSALAGEEAGAEVAKNVGVASTEAAAPFNEFITNGNTYVQGIYNGAKSVIEGFANNDYNFSDKKGGWGQAIGNFAGGMASTLVSNGLNKKFEKAVGEEEVKAVRYLLPKYFISLLGAGAGSATAIVGAAPLYFAAPALFPMYVDPSNKSPNAQDASIDIIKDIAISFGQAHIKW